MTIAESAANVQFDTALRAAANRALATHPMHEARIRRGYEIALRHGVDILPDGTALVPSQSTPGETYHVNGTCPCKDNAPQGVCKHRWAKLLTKAAVADRRRSAGVDRWYATYTAPDKERHAGIAEWDASMQCWLFTPDDGTEPLYPAIQAVALGGHLPTAEGQRKTEGDLVRKICGMTRQEVGA